MTIHELREKRAKAWEAAKAFLDSHRTGNGTLTAEDDTTYTRMEQEITKFLTRVGSGDVSQHTSERISTMSPDSMATAAPLPMAAPMSA